MTQNSDSGDAVGDAGPATDKRILAHQGKKRFNRARRRACRALFGKCLWHSVFHHFAVSLAQAVAEV
jgi:hypothetical protein